MDNLTYITRNDENGKPFPHENKRKVFISYKKSDNLFGIRDRIIKYILSVFDCAVWFDDSLTPGVDFDHEIEDALKKCDVVVLLLTPNILDSKYVWDIEIKHALYWKKGIIPVVLGIDSDKLNEVDKILGHIQLLDGNCLLDSESTVEQKNIFLEKLSRAIRQFLLNRDFVACVESFFASDKHLLPAKFLSLEQLYYMAFGFLVGAGVETDSEEAEYIMDSILQIYSRDKETELLKGEILCTLIKHSIKIKDFEKAKKYISMVERYEYSPAFYYVGYLYEGTIETNYEVALKYYKKASSLGCLDSTKAVARLLLKRSEWNSSKEAFEDALPFLLKAREMGGTGEAIDLFTAMWNYNKTVSSREEVCRLLLEIKEKEIGEKEKIYDFLKTKTCEPSILMKNTAKEYGFIEESLRLGEIIIQGHHFFLYREKIGENNNDILLFRDEKVIYEFPCWARGFGDTDFFDICEENGFIVVKSSSFCHYDVESDLWQNTFLNPLSDNLLIISHDNETKRGRVMLKYSSY